MKMRALECKLLEFIKLLVFIKIEKYVYKLDDLEKGGHLNEYYYRLKNKKDKLMNIYVKLIIFKMERY